MSSRPSPQGPVPGVARSSRAATDVPPVPAGIDGEAVRRLLLEREVERLLFEEARLLDEWDLDGWLALFAPTLKYWVPYFPGTLEGDRVLSMVLDDRAHLEERIFRLRSKHSTPQQPRSRTCRSVSGVTVAERTDGTLEARSSQIVVELRHGHQRVFAAHCTFRLVRSGRRWLIEGKRVDLVNQGEALGDLTFLL